MKTMKRICLLLLVLTSALAGAPGEDFRTDINPALLYYRAFLVPTEPISEADWKYLASKKGKEQKLPERFGKIAAGYDAQFALVRQAAQCTVPCDWGIDFSPGPNIVLPHLARAKGVCLTAQLRATWALQQGRQTEARDELLAAFALGRNVASDTLLISTYVQLMIEAYTYGTVAQHFGEFSPETLKELVDGFDAAPARHLMAACIPGEKSLGDWTLRQIRNLQQAHPGDDAKVMAGFHETGIAQAMESVGESNFWPRLLAASGGTSEGVIKLVHESADLFPRFAQLLELPQPEYETQAKEFSTELQKTQNPFVAGFRLILGGWQNRQFRPTEFKAQAQQAMVHAAVEYKLHGESGLKRVTDPFGNGPFSFRRFAFKGTDRGFELKSAYTGAEAPFVMIFVEKQGSAFQVIGPDAGKPISE